MTRPEPTDPGATDAEAQSPAADAEAQGPAAPPWRPTRFVDRIGAALVAPRHALAQADRRDAAGTAGSDLAALLGLVFLAVYAREIVFTGWVAVAESVGGGLTSLANVITRAVATDLAVLFVAGFALTVIAGAKRSLGRDFDLVCVAFVPIICVRLVAELLAQGFGLEIVGPWHTAVAVTAYGWALVLFFLAWQTARMRAPDSAADSAAEREP